MSKEFIPVCEPYFIGNEVQYVNDAVSSTWISSAGTYLNKFEEGFAKYCGREFGVATTSGTTALHLALVALDIKEGDEVILQDFTMAAVLKSILYCRATPVFVDVEKETWNIDPALIEKKITPKTKAIIVAHTYGHPADMDPIASLAKKHNLALVEDAAEVHGANYKGRMCGSFGDLSCFSFFGNKIITTGEGGMVLTSDKHLAERCKYFKNLCFPLTGPRDYIHNDLGFNYRMTNVQAALGLAQFEKIDELAELRRKNAAHYIELLRDIPGITLPVEKENVKNVYWMFGIVIDPKTFGMNRDELMAQLKAEGIDTRLFFRPLHNQKMLDAFGVKDTGDYPVSQWLSENGFYLPSGSGLKPEHVERICKTIKMLKQ